MLSFILDGIAVSLVVSLIVVGWLSWRSGLFRKDLDD